MKWHEREDAGDPRGTGAETKPFGDDSSGSVEPKIPQQPPPDKRGGSFRIVVARVETLFLSIGDKQISTAFRSGAMSVDLRHGKDPSDLVLAGVKVRARRWISFFSLS